MKDEEILMALLAKDEVVFDSVIKQYSKLLWAVAYSILGKNYPSHDVQELVSDVFMRLWRSPEKYEPSRGSLKNYLALITRSLALNKLRRKAIFEYEEVCLEEELQTPVQHPEIWTAFLVSIQELKEPTKEICIQRFVYEQKPETISRLTGLSKSEVNNRLYKGERKLRQLMAKQLMKGEF